MFRSPRGTADILPADQPYWRYVESTAAELCERFGYGRIETPIFEDAKLFNRSVGEATDIVEKETYTFKDRGNDELTLRPEGTAATCRAYLEHGMHVLPQPVRLYSVNLPMFRYDRPQAGRYRQFHQVNLEAIGSPEAAVDGEVIEVAWRLFAKLGLKNLTVVMNSIGDASDRPAYIAALKKFYEPLQSQLCGDCKRRFETNPLRLLDCKKETCRPHTENAPHTLDFLSATSRAHWDELTSSLKALEIPFTSDHRLVRGLDYYTHTVFEVVPQEDGAQSTIGGGGRYDGLIEQLGGKATPAVGFATGMERIILNLKRQGVTVPGQRPIKAVVLHLGSGAKPHAVSLASSLRESGVTAVLAPGGKSLKAQMRYAESVGAAYALILGDDEVRQGVVAVKKMADGTQQQVAIGEAARALL